MPIILDKPICENMRKIRLEKGLTQKQVAEACGMVDATYRTYELGKANPKPATVARIAKALGVPVEAVYGVDLANGMGTQPSNVSSAVYQSLLINQGGAIPIDGPNQNRLFAAYDRLNAAGQLEAIKRVEELGQMPTYQASPDLFDGLTEDERNEIKQCLKDIQETELELTLMSEKNPPVPDSNSAMVFAKKIVSKESKRITEILLNALANHPDISEH